MADRFWVGGTGNWSDATNHWATTDGGAPGAGNLPTSADNARFTAASNTTAYTVTVDATANCADLKFEAAPSVSGTITLAGSAALNVYGSLLMLSGMTRTYTGLITFRSTSTGKTVTTNGVFNGTTALGGLTFNGVGGGWTFSDAILATTTSAVTISLVNGALDFNGLTHKFYSFLSTGSTARTLTITNSDITVLSQDQQSWSVTPTLLTLNATGSTITSRSAVPCFNGGAGLAYNNVILEANAGQNSLILGAFTCVNLTLSITGTAPVNGTISGNVTVTGTFTSTNYDEEARLTLRSTSYTVARTITAAAVSLTKTNFVGITGAGAAAPFTGTELGDGGHNSGITFPASATLYWYSATGGTKYYGGAYWFLGSGGTGGAGRTPLPQDDVVFDANSVVAGTTIAFRWQNCGVTIGRNVSFAAVTNSPVWAMTWSLCYGSLTLKTGMVNSSGNYTMFFRGRASHTLTTGGMLMPPCALEGQGGTLSLQDALTCAAGNVFSVYAGTFVSNGWSIAMSNRHVVSGGVFDFSNSLFTLQNSGALIASHAAGTIVATGSTFKFTDATSTVKGLTLNNNTYGTIWLSGAGSGSFNFNTANTFAELKVSDGPKTIKFASSTNTTVTTFTGFDTNTPTFNTVSGTGQFELTKAGGGTVSMPGANVTNSNASPANTFYAGAAGVDGGNNLDWLFSGAPTNVALTGISVAAQAGSFAPGHSISVAGAEANVLYGSLAPSLGIGLSGLELAAESGNIVRGIILQGEQVSVSAGTLGVRVTAGVLAARAGGRNLGTARRSSNLGTARRSSNLATSRRSN